MNFIPYFFYDMTELRQKSIVKVLQLRAMFEDYGNGILNDKDIVSTIEMIEEASELSKAEPKNINEIKNAVKKASSRLIKGGKKALRSAVDFNESIEISKIVMEEVNKFSMPEWQYKLDEAQKLYDAGLDGLNSDSYDYLKKFWKKQRQCLRKQNLSVKSVRLQLSRQETEFSAKEY